MAARRVLRAALPAALVAMLLAAPGTVSAGALTLYPFHPAFPVAGDGPMFDFDSESQLTLALAHTGWSLAVPLLGEHIGGRKGLWIAGVSWLTVAVVQQSFFHTPRDHSGSYNDRIGAEFRTDLLTKLGPCLIVLAVDLARHGW